MFSGISISKNIFHFFKTGFNVCDSFRLVYLHNTFKILPLVICFITVSPTSIISTYYCHVYYFTYINLKTPLFAFIEISFHHFFQVFDQFAHKSIPCIFYVIDIDIKKDIIIVPASKIVLLKNQE